MIHAQTARLPGELVLWGLATGWEEEEGVSVFLHIKRGLEDLGFILQVIKLQTEKWM